jgi:hypothetical protein
MSTLKPWADNNLSILLARYKLSYVLVVIEVDMPGQRFGNSKHVLVLISVEKV